jgi:hypothetical protein
MIDVLIDVDGVINALARANRPEWGWSADSYLVRKIMGFEIQWSTELIAQLALLHERDDVEIFWLTTWLDQAPAQLAPVLGLPEWPVIGHEPYRRDNPFSRGKPGLAQNVNDWWKLDAAQEHFNARQNRIVWIDDDLTSSTPAQQWIKKMNRTSEIVLGVSPDHRHGITRDLFEKIAEWIEVWT